jgi:hypothetical protein
MPARSRFARGASVPAGAEKTPESDEREEYVQRVATCPLTSAVAVLKGHGPALSRIVDFNSTRYGLCALGSIRSSRAAYPWCVPAPRG